MKIKRLISIICCLLMLTGSLAAQEQVNARYNMSVIDLTAGLPHNYVNQIYTDSQGFIWISTYGGGAVRYDGYTFMKPTVSHGTDVISNSCLGFAEDGHQRLWMAYDESTVVINLKTMGNVTPSYGKGDISAYLSQPTARVYSDSKGGLWQVTRDSIFRYTFQKDGKVAHISRCGYRGNTPGITLRDIEHNGSVWINIENGLYRLSESGETLVRKDIAPAAEQLQGLYVTDMLKRGSTIWIATNLGLYAYDQYNNRLTSYRHSADPNSLSHDFATSLAITPDGQLLIGSLRGVNILDEQTGTFSHWSTASPKKPLPSDFVLCLMIREGQIWIGTETAGIVKITPQPFLLRNYIHDDQDPGSLSANPVNAMYVEPDGTLWAGTVEGGLNRRDANGHFAHWTTSNSLLSHNSVSVLAPDTHGRLWIGTWGGGVNVINTATHDGLHHLVLPAPMAPLTDYIGSLAFDPYNEALWIGSNDGIFFYDLKNETLEDPFDGNRDIRGCIGAHIDKDGQLWMGCLTGVCIIDLHSRKKSNGTFAYRHLRNKLDRPGSPVIDKISCFCETKDGTLWLGSNGYGLYRRVIDAKSGEERFEGLTTENGIANNAVKSIVEDVQGRLWITTNNGLSIYNPITQTFNNYFEQDGLACQRFYWNSAVKGPDGAIYLGSINSLTEIRGENDDVHPSVRLTFTRLQVDNQMINADNSDIIDADISQAKRIILHESNKSMAIDFSTLTYMGESQEHYSYRMKGFEDEWTTLKPGEHSVRYTSLKPGVYTFEVKYTSGDKSDNHVISIGVEVKPYFWKSWWFTLLWVMALTALGVWLYRMRIASLRQKEAEKLLAPIRKVLDESDAPEHLQVRIQNILDSHEHMQNSLHRSIEADHEEAKALTFMERATAAMEQHYMDSEFGIEEFAESIGMSRSQLSKRMNAEAGMSAGHFIRDYRLRIARQMLIDNVANRNIKEIAYRVGFNDPKYFTRCFTNLYGCSPSTYVEKLKEE